MSTEDRPMNMIQGWAFVARVNMAWVSFWVSPYHLLINVLGFTLINVQPACFAKACNIQSLQKCCILHNHRHPLDLWMCFQRHRQPVDCQAWHQTYLQFWNHIHSRLARKKRQELLTGCNLKPTAWWLYQGLVVTSLSKISDIEFAHHADKSLAFASIVFPVPGGPYRRIPFAWRSRYVLNISGCWIGKMTLLYCTKQIAESQGLYSIPQHQSPGNRLSIFCRQVVCTFHTST